MQVFYLAHSGFLIETTVCYYLFDYYQGELPPLEVQKPMVVLASHHHQDHYNPEIFSLLQERGINKITAVLAKDITAKNYPSQDIPVIKAYAHQSCDLPGEAKLETLLSTDAGVAYLLTTAEGVVYHAGDLNDWSWAGENDDYNKQMRARYRHEIDLLKGRAIDLAFVPLDPRQEEFYAAGLLYFLQNVSVKYVYPMHYWQDPAIIDRFLSAYPQYASQIIYPEKISRKELDHGI